MISLCLSHLLSCFWLPFFQRRRNANLPGELGKLPVLGARFILLSREWLVRFLNHLIHIIWALGLIEKLRQGVTSFYQLLHRREKPVGQRLVSSSKVGLLELPTFLRWLRESASNVADPAHSASVSRKTGLVYFAGVSGQSGLVQTSLILEVISWVQAESSSEWLRVILWVLESFWGVERGERWTLDHPWVVLIKNSFHGVVQPCWLSLGHQRCLHWRCLTVVSPGHSCEGEGLHILIVI